jgi:UDP-glucose 4-epimerase
VVPGKALVTGAYGFIGRHVARALANHGFEVRAIGHGPWGRDEWRNWGIVDWHLGDVTLDSLITYGGEPDLIFHCAGSGSVSFSMTHPYQDYQRTVATTHCVLEYIRSIRTAAALVFPSSAAVYGTTQTSPISVNAPLEPASPYGMHKKIAEDLCRAYGRHFGVRSLLVRFFSIYGIGLRKQLLWDACNKIAAGDLIFSGTGDETRDWLHVEDAASLMIHGAQHAAARCTVINGGTGDATRIDAIVSAIADDLSSPQPPHFSGISRPGDPTNYQADIDQAIGWGWKPTRHLREEIRLYVQWFKDGAR